MGDDFRQTLARETEISGYGVHTGRPARVRLYPAESGEGIAFIREDLPGRPRLPASWDFLGAVDRGTTLASDSVRVRTVEHLLAALAGLGVDDVLIGVEGDEIPIADGSAAPYADAILAAGLKNGDVPRLPLALSRPLWVESGDSLLAAFPSKVMRFDVLITLEAPAPPAQFFSYLPDPSTFVEKLAPARTFGYLKEALPLIERGLARGSGLENTVVIAEEAVFSRDGLRFPDEFVRHKVLDMVGDFALLGRPLLARVVAIRPGHRLNTDLVRQIMEEEADE